MPKTYFVAVRSTSRTTIDKDWQQALSAIPGVSVVGATPNRAQIEATDDAMKAVAKLLGEHFYIEEQVQREPT